MHGKMHWSDENDNWDAYPVEVVVVRDDFIKFIDVGFRHNFYEVCLHRQEDKSYPADNRPVFWENGSDFQNWSVYRADTMAKEGDIWVLRGNWWKTKDGAAVYKRGKFRLEITP